MKISRVIIVLNRGKDHAVHTAETLKSILDRRKIKQQWYDCFEQKKNLYRQLNDLQDCKADLIMAVGGDGTLLQAAHRSKGTGIPLLGINIGYLGFISSIRGNEVRRDIERILNTEYVVSERTALDLSVQKGKKRITGWALNDVVVTRGDNPHLINLDVKVGNKDLTGYRCDGLIIATPTGSTAYSLAAGGPIVSPECSVLTITPICPHALSNRSVIVNSNEIIRAQICENSGTGTVQIDGMELTRIDRNSQIIVENSRDTVPIAYLPEVNHYDTLGKKLKWTGDGVRDP